MLLPILYAKDQQFPGRSWNFETLDNTMLDVTKVWLGLRQLHMIHSVLTLVEKNWPKAYFWFVTGDQIPRYSLASLWEVGFRVLWVLGCWCYSSYSPLTQDHLSPPEWTEKYKCIQLPDVWCICWCCGQNRCGSIGQDKNNLPRYFWEF